MKRLRETKGFSLVELAIVLVIIGIILGAVLKGQELINNAKIKRAFNQQREIFAAFYTYFDRYGKFPGDDNIVATRWPASVNGNNNGLIDSIPALSFMYNCTGAEAAGEESCNAWRHLRLTNIIVGSGRTNPQHSYAGAISVAYSTVNGVSVNWIAFQNVPRDVAYTIDTQYDDGIWNTGTIQGSDDFTVAGAPITLYFKL
jgi:prepilin-type N-terminal cleavage/methylation domain-containing protein